MNTQRNHNDNQTRREELLRMVRERMAAREAAESHVIHSTVYNTSNPGPDFTPRPFGSLNQQYAYA
ncbi:MAG: hypothetical protein FWH34_00245 [Desulfovibrionaceae bacterium]|nr:hypothetical protein [Desulfovibrionaceae bacterium]